MSIPVGLGDVLVTGRAMFRLRGITLALVLLGLHMPFPVGLGDVFVTVFA